MYGSTKLSWSIFVIHPLLRGVQGPPRGTQLSLYTSSSTFIYSTYSHLT